MTTEVLTQDNIQITGVITEKFAKVLSPQAVAFVATLHRKFNSTRKDLLLRRRERQKAIDSGILPDFLKETEEIRNSQWQVAAVLPDLLDRRVEITGPVERKMMINALNSGASAFMADFEDSNSPSWENVLQGQINLSESIERTISFVNENGKEYKLNEKIATLLVRPRGWHLTDKNFLIDDEPVSASIMDFGLYFFHNVQNLLDRGSAPYFYLPKMESHLEARLWNDIFLSAQEMLEIPRGTIKATVLIETILAAFEMEEILYELREHSAGLNAGRWDYIFSCIKKFRNYPEYIFPDRSQISMTVPFMRAYSELLVKTCHRRGAFAMGGMSAFIPSRKDEEVNRVALTNVRNDKERESRDGFDGTWVAHPDLVPIAKEIFDRVLADKPNQIERQREDVSVSAADLLNFRLPEGKITEAGIRNNISVAIQYMGAWLKGMGAVAIHNLMEDAATAEISRSQLWQWLHNEHALLTDGRKLDADLYKKIKGEELAKIKDLFASAGFEPYILAGELLDKIVLEEEFNEFLTLIAYQYIN